jgi:hypothetical protein
VMPCWAVMVALTAPSLIFRPNALNGSHRAALRFSLAGAALMQEPSALAGLTDLASVPSGWGYLFGGPGGKLGVPRGANPRTAARQLQTIRLGPAAANPLSKSRNQRADEDG